MAWCSYMKYVHTAGHTRRCRAWAGQCAVYVAVLVFEKILMTILVRFDFWKKVSLYNHLCISELGVTMTFRCCK